MKSIIGFSKKDAKDEVEFYGLEFIIQEEDGQIFQVPLEKKNAVYVFLKDNKVYQAIGQ